MNRASTATASSEHLPRSPGLPLTDAPHYQPADRQEPEMTREGLPQLDQHPEARAIVSALRSPRAAVRACAMCAHRHLLLESLAARERELRILRARGGQHHTAEIDAIPEARRALRAHTHEVEA